MAAAPDAWLAVECDEGGLKHRETPGECNIFYDALGERPILLVRVNVDTTTTKPAHNNWLGQTALLLLLRSSQLLKPACRASACCSTLRSASLRSLTEGLEGLVWVNLRSPSLEARLRSSTLILWTSSGRTYATCTQ